MQGSCNSCLYIRNNITDTNPYTVIYIDLNSMSFFGQFKSTKPTFCERNSFVSFILLLKKMGGYDGVTAHLV